jgi:two-component system, chemotaxis family, chemotaxis protein CheY
LIDNTLRFGLFYRTPDTGDIVDLRSIRFLIVDDHSLTRMIVGSELKKYGAAVIDEAADGVEGLRKIKQASETDSPYHIVFLDWAMPNLGGHDVLVTCREDKNLDSMAIVMLSSESEDDNILKTLEAGATAYITKPFKPETLAKKIEDVLAWKPKK